MLLKLTNGGIMNITSDKDYVSGCDTCDYGSSYVTYFDVELTRTNIRIEASKMYDYPLSEQHMMNVMLKNVDKIKLMSEERFTEWLEGSINNEVENVQYEIYDKLNKRGR